MLNFVIFASKRIDNGNTNESHLGMKKLHLNRKGNSAVAKNLLNYLENYLGEVSESFLRNVYPRVLRLNQKMRRVLYM